MYFDGNKIWMNDLKNHAPKWSIIFEMHIRLNFEHAPQSSQYLYTICSFHTEFCMPVIQVFSVNGSIITSTVFNSNKFLKKFTPTRFIYYIHWKKINYGNKKHTILNLTSFIPVLFIHTKYISCHLYKSILYILSTNPIFGLHIIPPSSPVEDDLSRPRGVRLSNMDQNFATLLKLHTPSVLHAGVKIYQREYKFYVEVSSGLMNLKLILSQIS